MKGKRIRLVGLPGTGKTTRLLKYLDELLKNHKPTEIVYCSFSNAAVNEAKERVHKKFNIDHEELKYFKTMHALCLRLLKDANHDIGSNPASDHDFQQFLLNYGEHYPDLADYLEDLKIYATTQLYVSAEEKDDPLCYYTLGTNPSLFFKNVFNYMYASYGCTPLTSPNFPYLVELRDRINLPKRYFKPLYMTLLNLEREWRNYKNEHDLFEFDELLYKVHSVGLVPKVSILIVDEYQDSSKLQAKIVDMWAPHMQQTIVAGDPNQAIYGFNGADPSYLEGFDADRTELLHQTWRMPQVAVDYAISILNNHWTEEMIAAMDKPGLVAEVEWSEIQWFKYKTVYVLGRTGSILKTAQRELADLGILGSRGNDKTAVTNLLYQLYYSYKQEIEVPATVLFGLKQIIPKLFDPQIRTVLNKMEDLQNEMSGPMKQLDKNMLSTLLGVNRSIELQQLISRVLKREQLINFRKLIKTNAPPVQLSDDFPSVEFMTAHASKGKEADCIILLTSASWYESEGRINEEEEKRVYFVAATRTKQDLLLVNIEDSRERTKFLPIISSIVELT